MIGPELIGAFLSYVPPAVRALKALSDSGADSAKGNGVDSTTPASTGAGDPAPIDTGKINDLVDAGTYATRRLGDLLGELHRSVRLINQHALSPNGLKDLRRIEQAYGPQISPPPSPLGSKIDRRT